MSKMKIVRFAKKECIKQGDFHAITLFIGFALCNLLKAVAKTVQYAEQSLIIIQDIRDKTE
jgi:hypothetical protein